MGTLRNANSQPDLFDRDIIPTKLAVSAMRDSGYRNTAYALAELIDNSVQAGADLVEVYCVESYVRVTERQRRRVTDIAVLDNGHGMTPEVLDLALQFGNGTHLKDRSGIGRFGMGLPNASISQARRVDIWTWQSGPDNAIHSYLDVDEIEGGTLKEVPPPKAEPVPASWRQLSANFATTGTLVVWTRFDEERLTWKSARATLDNTEILAGRMYRKFIAGGDLNIKLYALENGNRSVQRSVRVNDPLYLLPNSSTPAPFDAEPMFQVWDETPFEISFRGGSHTVKVIMSYAKDSTVPPDGTDRGQKPYGKHAGQNLGLSIVRARRELDLDRAWARTYDPTERWWGVEVQFPAELDEVFGVTNNKQTATTFSNLVNFEWESEAEPGETFLAFRERLEKDGDPRARLIDIVSHIERNLRLIREKIKDQNKGRRGARRHIDTGVEDRATTKFKERAESGHKTESDAQVFDRDAKDALVTDLKGKKYSEQVAQDIAAAVHSRKRKVIFVEASSEMDAFFSVEPKPGGITEIIFNSTHPAHRSLLMALDGDTAESTDKDLVMRITNASDTLKMLFAAWARQEIEDVKGREKLVRFRQDWGRMARDFLTDGDGDE